MDAVTGYSGMRRVLVIGCPGAGKSTFARRLRDAAGLPLHYLDMLWHNPDRTTVTRAEFDERLQRILEEDAWILDGNFARTLPKRLEYCDTVFFLDFPTDVCLEGVEGCSGMKREDMRGSNTNSMRSSVSTSIDFPAERRPQMVDALEDAAARRGVRVHTTSKAELVQALADVLSGLEVGRARACLTFIMYRYATYWASR